MAEPPNDRVSVSVPRARLIAAFAAVYLLWGSSYLAIRFAIETIPPFLMGGARFLMAGAILYGWERTRTASCSLPQHWLSALIIGAFLILGGNGSVVWAEQFIPSGLTALLIATEPLWIVILLWGMGRERVPSGGVVGLVLGFAGVAFLIGPEDIAGGGRIDVRAAGVVLMGTLSWAIGSLYSRSATQAESQILSTAMSMLSGGALMVGLALLLGELSDFDPGAVSLKSGLAFVYLVLFPSLLAFTAYLWLMKTVSPDRASTYAYVNPIVAVTIGWALASEPVNPRIIISMTIIMVALWLVMSRRTVGSVG